MMNSSPVDPAEYLLAQFDAIYAFERGIRALRVGVPPHTMKTWYLQDQVQAIQKYDGALEMCQDLEKVVPTDHPYWHNPLGA